VPRRGGGEWVACLEDVLGVYCRPYDPCRPQICLDECGKQLLTDAVAGEPMEPGKPERFDYHYERHGVCRVFVASEPLAGKRWMQVRPQRTRQDWAQVIKALVDVHYPTAEKLVLVMDNLNTHTLGSLYETFEPAEAERLSRKLELHYTPTYASWLNIAEIELSVLSRQCLDRRMGTLEQVQQEVAVWQDARNQARVGVDWRFTTADARIKLKRLYPLVT
jgi:DDE superfamily endonuclease